MPINFFEELGGSQEETPSSNILGRASDTGNTGGFFQQIWDSYVPRQITPPKPISNKPVGQMKSNPSVDEVFQRLIKAESRGQHRNAKGELTRSPVGAEGITQVMPKTGVDPGYGVAPLRDDSEKEYLRFGKDLLTAYTNELGGDIRKGLAAYNHGIGAVQKKINRYGDEWETKLPAETKKYLKTILGSQVVQYAKAADISDKTAKELQNYHNLLEKQPKLNEIMASYVTKMEENDPLMKRYTSFLKIANAVPKVAADIYSEDKGGEFRSSGNIFNDGSGGVVAFRAGVGSKLLEGKELSDNDKNLIVHEYTHAVDRQLNFLYNTAKKDKSPLSQQFQQAYEKLGGEIVQKNDKWGSARSTLADKLNAEWSQSGKKYRATSGELPAFAMGSTQGGDFKAPDHIDTTFATEFDILLGIGEKYLKEYRTAEKKKDKK